MRQFKDNLERQTREIRSLLDKRQRQIVPGCLIKVSLSQFFGEDNVQCNSVYIYGIVGTQRAVCDFSEARAYDVLFSLDGVNIDRDMFHIFTIPIYENEMEILRFPEQNASLDDPNIDRYFHRIDGKWISRSSNNINY